MRPAGQSRRPAPETVGRAAARVFGGQLAVIRRSHATVYHGSHPEALHDLRVALRRFRAGLRLFPVPRVPAELDGRLDTLTTGLGPLRDLDVWLAFLESEHVPARALVESTRRERARRARGLRAWLHAAPWPETLEALADLLQRLSLDDPALQADFGVHAATRVDEAWDRFRKRATGVTETSPAARSHALRKAARRVRYFTEFAQRTFEPPMAALTTQIHAVARALGYVHDMDVFAENTRAIEGRHGEQLRAAIAARRHRHWLEYRQTLDALPAPDSLRELIIPWRRGR